MIRAKIVLGLLRVRSRSIRFAANLIAAGGVRSGDSALVDG